MHTHRLFKIVSSQLLIIKNTKESITSKCNSTSMPMKPSIKMLKMIHWTLTDKVQYIIDNVITPHVGHCKCCIVIGRSKHDAFLFGNTNYISSNFLNVCKTMNKSCQRWASL